MTLATHTLGCKLNFAETSHLQRQLQSVGFDIVSHHEVADVYVINTCTVTAVATKKCRNAIRQAVALNPDAVVAVIGCFAQTDADQIARIPGVDIILGNDRKHLLPEILKIENGKLKVERTYPPASRYPSQEGTLPHPDNSQFSILNSQLILYQGAVNVGRGVRELTDVMGRLPQCRLVVAGDGDLLEDMKTYAATLSWTDRIVFLGRVCPEELHTLTAKADLGVCLLEDLGQSYRCALPNRVGDFAQAGVPLVATGFVEIRRVLEEYGIGTPTEPCPQMKEGKAYEQYLDRLADTIAETLHRWQTMPSEERERRFARARKELCWENEKKILMDKIDAIIN